MGTFSESFWPVFLGSAAAGLVGVIGIIFNEWLKWHLGKPKLSVGASGGKLL